MLPYGRKPFSDLFFLQRITGEDVKYDGLLSQYTSSHLPAPPPVPYMCAHFWLTLSGFPVNQAVYPFAIGVSSIQ